MGKGVVSILQWKTLIYVKHKDCEDIFFTTNQFLQL
jgi:hypothetical protein